MTQATAPLHFMTLNRSPRPLLPQPPSPAPYPGELLGGAVSRISEEVCVPPAMAAQAVLASAALVVQAHAQIQLQGRLVPLSLYLLSVGTSGDRHTTVESLTLQAHYAWDRAQGRTHHEPCFLLSAMTLERLVENLPQG